MSRWVSVFVDARTWRKLGCDDATQMAARGPIEIASKSPSDATQMAAPGGEQEWVREVLGMP